MCDLAGMIAMALFSILDPSLTAGVFIFYRLTLTTQPLRGMCGSMKKLLPLTLLLLTGCFTRETEMIEHKSTTERIETTETMPVVVNGAIHSFTAVTVTTKTIDEDTKQQIETVSKAEIGPMIQAGIQLAMGNAPAAASSLLGAVASPEGAVTGMGLAYTLYKAWNRVPRPKTPTQPSVKAVRREDEDEG